MMVTSTSQPILAPESSTSLASVQAVEPGARRKIPGRRVSAERERGVRTTLNLQSAVLHYPEGIPSFLVKRWESQLHNQERCENRLKNFRKKQSNREMENLFGDRDRIVDGAGFSTARAGRNTPWSWDRRRRGWYGGRRPGARCAAAGRGARRLLATMSTA
jgi:hypothetical protein